MKETEKITEKITERITEKDASNNVEDEELKSYRKMRRQHLFDTRLNSSLQFDKQIIYVASGAIGLIFTLRTTTDKIETCAILIIALIFLIVAISLNLISYLTAIRGIDKDFVDNDESADKWDMTTHWLNRLSLISIFVGMVLLIVYFI